ncbi:hypothetical protein Taro_019894 [Colocasia esculenta]|uniref:Retrotransposon gag domain-containing protein n=1 Tax=Colocasia esculenta TaxID=4460 RepID=A0A843UY24_COLES|nr:hypothetical protein [Colocasia esculenta]
MVAAERPATTALAVRVAAGVSVAFLPRHPWLVVGVDATCQAVATASRSSRFDRAFGIAAWRAVATWSRRSWASRQRLGAIGVDVPFVQGVCSGRPVRGGGGVRSYEKALTGSFFVWRVPRGTAPEPCSAGNAVASEAATMSRRCDRSLRGRDAPESRVKVRLLSSGRAHAGRRRRGSSRVDVYFRYISCQTCVIALSGPPDPWAATAKIGSSAWAEGRVLGSLQLDMASRRRSHARQLVEQQDESDMPAQGQVQEEVSVEESVVQPQGAQAAAAEAAFFRAMYQGVWQPGQAATGGQFPVPPPAVPEQQEVEPEVEQPVRQQRSGTGSTRSGQRRAAVSEARTALLERFLRLRPPMFHGEYDPDKAESWTHELERIFETMECAEEDQVRLAVYQLKGAAHEWWRVQRQTHFQGQWLDQITWQRFSEVFHGEYFPDYARRERRDQFHELMQGDLSVSQYHQRFVRLLTHVPHVAGSDQACAERFIAGLRPDLRWGVTAHMCTTLGEAVVKATALDRETWQPQQ